MVCRVTEVTAKRVGLQVTGISCYHENMLIQKELTLTLILLTWRIRWAPNNASKWQKGFKSAFKGLNTNQYGNGEVPKVVDLFTIYIECNLEIPPEVLEDCNPNGWRPKTYTDVSGV